MADKFTTVITDPNIVNKLPDLSVLDKYYDDSSTIDDLKEFIDSEVLRQKLQQLLSYKLDDDVKALLQKNLIDSYIASAGEDATVNRINDSQIEVNGKFYTVYLHSFGDGIFSNDHFNSLFFTTDVIDEILAQNDSYFEASLYETKKFWDLLLANNDLWQHFKEKKGAEIIDIANNHEIAYVKMAIKESGSEAYSEIDNILTLVDRSAIFTGVLANSDSNSLTIKTRYGQRANVLYLASIKSLSDLNNEDILSKIDNSDALKNAVAKVYVLEVFEHSDAFYQKIVNNDTLLGLLVSSYYNLADKVSFSQIIYSSDYKDTFKAMINDISMLSILENSSLVSTIGDDFFNNYYANSFFKNVLYALNNGDSISAVAVNNNKEINILNIVFPDETSDTFDVPVTKVNLSDTSLVVAPALMESNSDTVFIEFDKSITSNNNDLMLLFSSFVGKHFIDVQGNRKHLHAIDFDGNIINSKFYYNDKIDTTKYKSSQINEEVALIDVTDTYVVLGNTNIDPKVITHNLNANIDNIDTAFILDKDVYIVTTDKKVQIATADGFVDSDVLDGLRISESGSGSASGSGSSDSSSDETAAGNGIMKVVKIGNYIVALDKTNKMWYIEGENVVTIENIKDINVGQDALNVVDDSTQYAMFDFGNKLRKFTYQNNIK